LADKSRRRERVELGQLVLDFEPRSLTSAAPKPKAGDPRAWADHNCSVSMAGEESHKVRRHLLKTLLESARTLANWLTHSKSSKWHDAEAAVATTENAIGLCTSSVIRYMRGVRETCPAWGSHRLSPERGIRLNIPEIKWERPTCGKCDWKGEPVPILHVPAEQADRPPPEGDCTKSNGASQSIERAIALRISSIV
jgi:hypothetical protein